MLGQTSFSQSNKKVLGDGDEKYWQNSDAHDTCHVWNMLNIYLRIYSFNKKWKVTVPRARDTFKKSMISKSKDKMSRWNVMNGKVWYAIIAYNTETYLNKWPLQLESRTLYWK